MSTLYLIRHGQASFGAEDYDVLSTLGGEQSAHLGRHWAARGQRLDACYSGPKRRQIDTARHFRTAASEHGVSYPEAEILAGLDEYPALALLRHWLPRLSAEHPELRDLLDPAGRGPDSAQRWERAFATITGKWARGELTTDDIESFAAFQRRVHDAVEHIMTAQGRGKRVAVFTSGGPVAMAVQMAMGLAAEVALRTAWVVANAAVTEFRYRDRESLTLIRFNTIGHLPEPRLVTYR